MLVYVYVCCVDQWREESEEVEEWGEWEGKGGWPNRRPAVGVIACGVVTKQHGCKEFRVNYIVSW